MPKDYQMDEQGDTLGAINTPDLKPSLKSGRRAIKDAQQAFNIVRNLEEAARERNTKNARIMAKYNAEKPYTQSELEAEGLGWKSNFTTKPLPMLIDKVAPRFSKAIESVKFLTNSALPNEYPGAAVKTEAFRREITKLIRARPGWQNMIAEIAQENALFGYTCLAWLDEFSWFPKHFRQDSFFVPSGTKQLPNSAQIVALRETLLIHELFDLIENSEAARTAGWNIENTVNAINSAIPDDRRSRHSSWERVYEDLIREANVGLSHESGARSINLWHLLATEHTGKVSHYILREPSDGFVGNRNEGVMSEKSMSTTALFEREDRFDSMAEGVAFFSFQQGNSTLHGSKGIGREIYAIAAMVDRSRNEVVDRLNLAGKIIIQADDKALRRFKMSVVGSALLVGQGYAISERKIESGVREFLELDQFLTGLLDQMAGATTPKAFEGDRVTKAQVDLFAAREEESRDNIISRFLTQFADMMTTMQRRICNPDVADEDAQAFQKRMLQVMDRKELNELAKQPVASTVKDYTEVERQQIVMIATEARGNPLYNQKELERQKISAILNEDLANQILLPDNDPTVAAEQIRQQQMEMLVLVGQASEVPVSPRDNHLVHLQVMAPAMESAAQAATNGTEGLEVLQALLSHAEQHLAGAKQTGAPPDVIKEIGTFLSNLRKAVEQLNQLEAQQQQQMGPMPPQAGAGPEALPPAEPAAPPGPPV